MADRDDRRNSRKGRPAWRSREAMDHMPDSHDTFLLRVGPLRVVLLTVIMVFGAVVFLFIGATFAAIKVDSLLGRSALLLAALFLLMLAAYCLIILRTNIIRIEVGPERLKLRMPRLRGPLPLLTTIRAALPYADVASVETREEVYSTFGLVTVQRAYSLVTRDGVRLPLGVMAESWGFQMPFDQAAARIATRAGISIIDRGAVRVGGIIRAMLYDVPPWSTAAMTTLENKGWHRRATMTMQIIMLLIAMGAILRSCAG
jgi:hypothetical protein